MYVGHAVQTIRQHNNSIPLFYYLATEVAHLPNEAPARFLDKFNPATVPFRLVSPTPPKPSSFRVPPKLADTAGWCADDGQQYRLGVQFFSSNLHADTCNLDNAAPPHFDYRPVYAMSSIVDESLQNVTAALQANMMWETTLMVVASDNGGSLTQTKASNFPLRCAAHCYPPTAYLRVFILLVTIRPPRPPRPPSSPYYYMTLVRPPPAPLTALQGRENGLDRRGGANDCMGDWGHAPTSHARNKSLKRAFDRRVRLALDLFGPRQGTRKRRTTTRSTRTHKRWGAAEHGWD